MPNERDPQRGDIIYVKLNGVFEKCEVIEGSKDTRAPGLCMIKVLSTQAIIMVHDTQIVYNFNELKIKHEKFREWMQVSVEEAMDISQKAIIEECNSALSEMPDEYLDSIAPPEENSDLTSEQDEYRLMYNAVGSIGSILMTLLRCATSDNKLSDAELLALRDKAEAFENMDIVYAIDSHFEEGDA